MILFQNVYHYDHRHKADYTSVLFRVPPSASPRCKASCPYLSWGRFCIILLLDQSLGTTPLIVKYFLPCRSDWTPASAQELVTNSTVNNSLLKTSMFNGKPNKALEKIILKQWTAYLHIWTHLILHLAINEIRLSSLFSYWTRTGPIYILLGSQGALESEAAWPQFAFQSTCSSLSVQYLSKTTFFQSPTLLCETEPS